MFDEFVTKRLYGVSASDIIFFDNAIDRFGKRKALPSLNFARPNTAPVESSMRRLLNRVIGSSNIPIEDDEPLLQSAKLHRKLKTVVQPDPSGEGLDDEDDDLNIGYTYSSFPTKFDRLLFSTHTKAATTCGTSGV